MYDYKPYMSILSRKTSIMLLLGDIVAFVLALWATLLVRYGQLPTTDVFYAHFDVFAYIFFVWIIVYFIAGLYEREAALYRSALPPVFVNVQLINAAIAVGFFYFIPYSSIAPKTNLFLYFVISTIFVLIWRSFIYRHIVFEKRQKAILVGSGADMHELEKATNGNPNYHFEFVAHIDLDTTDALKFKEEMMQAQGDLREIHGDDAPLVVIDLYNEKVRALMPELYNLLLSGTRFIDLHQIYEGVFGRVALSLLGHSWFLENVSSHPKYVYDMLKRSMDFVIALVLGIISLIVYPFVYVAIKLDDGGPVFIIQERIGKDNQIIRIPKFRSMKTSDKGVWVKEKDSRITRVGRILRATRIDELPQLFSVLKGDMSLVGPRPDIRDLGEKLLTEIPYYNVRTIIKPGLSGWAQIRQDLPPQSLEETKTRLAFDFYYIKNRSFLLDLKIALQTLATLASRGGK